MVVGGRIAKAGKELKKKRKNKQEKTKLRTEEESGVKKQKITGSDHNSHTP
jgi:hypothetical protein